MVGFDTSFALLALRPGVNGSVDHAVERVAYVLSQLSEQKETILIPAPCLAELLAGAGPAAPGLVGVISSSARFRVAPFGTRAAIEIASFMAGRLSRAEKRGGHRDWAKFKFDHQIIAIAKVEGASALYTDDRDQARLARDAGLQVVTLADIHVPPSQGGLFEQGSAPLPPPPAEGG